MALAVQIVRGKPQRWRIMSLDGQVLVIAFFALALKLLLWSREEDVVRVDVEPDRKDVLLLDDSDGDSERERGQTVLKA
jgi:hypothetical protein